MNKKYLHISVYNNIVFSGYMSEWSADKLSELIEEQISTKALELQFPHSIINAAFDSSN